MLAGTLGVLETPADEQLESYFASGGEIPALDVEQTQTSFDDRPIQSGKVAGYVDETVQDISVGVTADGEPVAIDVEERPERTRTVTEWVADVTASGIIMAESVAGDDVAAFPFDLFWNVTGSKVTRPWIDVEGLHRQWSREDVLGDVWMVGKDPGDGAQMSYHDAADESDSPTFGLGFERPWNGTVMRGVAYESGYIAVYNTNHPSLFIRFIDEELMDHTDDGETGEQQTLSA